MCSKKPKVQAAEAAAPMSAPLAIKTNNLDTKKETGSVKAKGKKKLTITQAGTGTGVNL